MHQQVTGVWLEMRRPGGIDPASSARAAAALIHLSAVERVALTSLSSAPMSLNCSALMSAFQSSGCTGTIRALAPCRSAP